MSNKYLKGALETPTQLEPAPGTVTNTAGGQAFEVDKWDRLTRFLVLGSEGGTYYAGERELTKENVNTLRDLLAEDGVRFVSEVVALSLAGRAPKNDPALLALALAASADNAQTRAIALDALPDVARTATHLFTFLGFVEQLRGWGRGLRNAVANWYTEKDENKLAYQLVKYRNRAGFTHRDALRLAHPVPQTTEQEALFAYAAGKENAAAEVSGHVLFFEAAQASGSPTETAALVRRAQGKLTREMLKTEHLKDADVWLALLETEMPLTALVRNLATMTRVGVLKGRGLDLALAGLSDATRIKKSRIHPIAVLSGLRTYTQGRGFRGGNTWDPIAPVVDALNDAFYTAFGNVEPTGKSTMLALDVSSSMGWGEIAGIPGLTPADATAALALVTAAVEPKYSVYGFSTTFVSLPITKRQRLDDAMRVVRDRNFGGTDCALPMLYAAEKDLDVDAFIVYTDNETWAGRVHPDEALRRYRRKTGKDAKLVVVGMTATNFTIANPKDPGMLDVVGFDTATPQAISEFIR